MKKILITGSSGYIGSHLCKLLQHDYVIHGLDIVDPIIPVEKFYKLDITKPLTITEEYDCVIHLAALINVNQSQTNPIGYYNTNVFGTINTFDIKTNNYILASTGAAVNHTNVYGLSKKIAEQCVMEHMDKNNTDYTIFRFYNVVGHDGIEPKNIDGLMYNLIQAPIRGWFCLYGTDYDTFDGTCVRDYVHVNEICHSIKMAIEQPSKQIEHLGHGTGITVRAMIEIFKSVNDVEFVVYDMDRRIGDEAINVLDKPSIYMTKMYSFDDLLRIY